MRQSNICAALGAACVLAVCAGARGAIINVPADQPTIQAAAGVVQPGDEIVLAVGTYSNDVLPGFTNGFTIRGATGDPADVVIDGNGQAPFFLLAGTGITVRDITFTDCQNAIFVNNGGDATIMNCVFDANTTGIAQPSALLLEGGNTLVSDCVFTNNSSGGNGGAVAITNSAAATLSNCQFTGNTCGTGGTLGAGGGAVLVADSTPLIENCTFEMNTVINGTGGAVLVLASGPGTGPTIVDCDFTGNSAILPGGAGIGGAIGADGPTVTAVDRCRFYGNTATFGGAISCANSGTDPSEVHVSNSVFSGNMALDGPAIIDGFGGAIVLYTAAGPCTVTNCTFANNDAVAGGGVLDASPSSVIANSVFSGNSAASPGEDFVGGTPVFCMFSTPAISGTPGAGCILGVAASFVDEAGADTIPGTPDDDLHLVAGSAGVDAGDSGAPGLAGLFFDADGAARFQNDPTALDTGVGVAPPVDMGAYEVPGCAGDADGDGVVNINDISYVIFRLGDTGAAGTVDGDMNGDGVVDINDISFVIFQLGVPCP